MTLATHLEEVIAALDGADLVVSGKQETDVQAAASAALARAIIPHRREVTLGLGSRIDLLTTKGVGIEVKIGAWASCEVVAQLARYADTFKVRALVLLCERGIDLPPTLGPAVPVRLVRISAGRRIAV